MSTKFYRLALLAVAIGLTGWAHSNVPVTTRGDLGEDFVPAPIVARSMAFGFEALLADYYWLQAVQIVGAKESVDAQTARDLGHLIDVVTTLNPHVGHPYRFAAVWLNHNDELVLKGNQLLERAIEHHPEDWRNYFYLGFNHFFYLANYPEAASALENAMNLPGSPAYLPRLVARLKSQNADIDVAEVFLRELLQNTEDEEVEARLQAALDEIEIEYKARHLDRARAAYVELAGRDIKVVEDLIRNPHRVLEKLPSAEPDQIPAALSRGSTWEIDDQSDQIESSYLGGRYEIHYADIDRKRLEARDQNRETVSTEGRAEISGQ